MHYVVAAVAGIAIGYVAASTLTNYQPWTTAYAKGAGQ